MDKKLILASGSPRRKAFFEMLGLDFTVVTSDIDENLQGIDSAVEFVKTLAKNKAIAAKTDNAVIIAADTVVISDDKILGKPKDRAEAVEMLRSYSEGYHHVVTGFAILDGDKIYCDAEKTRVNFRKIEDFEIDFYTSTAEPYDKAGGYGIQGIAGLFIKSVDGDYNNVVGLPLCRLNMEMRKNFGYDLLEFRKND